MRTRTCPSTRSSRPSAPRDPSRNPLFQVNFRLVTTPNTPLDFVGVRSSSLPSEYLNSKFDAALELTVSRDRFHGYLEYSTDLFFEESAARMTRSFGRILQAVLERPDVSLSDLVDDDGVEAPRQVGGRKSAEGPLHPTKAEEPRRKRKAVPLDE